MIQNLLLKTDTLNSYLLPLFISQQKRIYIRIPQYFTTDDYCGTIDKLLSTKILKS